MEEPVQDGSDSPERAPWLVIGLGNPGPRYEATYHNVGFRVVDILAGRRGRAFPRQTDMAAIVACGPDLVLVKPATYMNASGRVLGLLFDRFGAAARLCVVSDDLALPLGKIRIRERGSAGGHNGLKSISSAYGSDDYVRVRVGIDVRMSEDVRVGKHKASVPESTRDYVLSRVPRSGRRLLSRSEELAADAVECLVGEGVPQAMSRYNGLDLRDTELTEKDLN